MFAPESLVFSLLALAGASSAYSLEARRTQGNNVTIVSLEKARNSTGGSGSVAAAGTLQPFGGIGIGCGVNWDNKVGYGGMDSPENTKRIHDTKLMPHRWLDRRLRSVRPRRWLQDHTGHDGDWQWYRHQWQAQCHGGCALQGQQERNV